MTAGARATHAARVRAVAASRFLFVLWAAGVWWVSSRSDPASDLHWPWEIPDKIVHGAVFAAGGFLARGAFSAPRPGRAAAAALVACSVWGAIDEIHQGFVPGRMTDPMDLAADVTGAALGVALCSAFAREARGARPPSR